ncbi:MULTISPECIES: cation diffusion facilitator family transporter [unclassified Halomonas]|uniref:cation diffusion facilitator family transporter n=1 Tax=unclassified Halomonas TaxID=2609666 RepID=UPI000C8DE8AC|nr:cation diffusion facilitator family transporter [Halomonas sp.]MAR74169.1 cation-efflux pump [Halomonas sp.]MBR9879021.1 cation diffusion facilitator family transporter [Gammaproteobacteria bacterium]
MSQKSQPGRSRHAFAWTAQGVTLIGAGVDLVVGVLKLVTGVIVGSAALIADGIHSFSDIVTDAFVLAATHYGRQEPDRDHPYGHGRIETLATLWLGSVLIFVAGAIAWSSVERLLDRSPSAAPGLVAIAVAVVSLLAKEAIYHYTLRAARRFDSPLLEANAWHSRTDAMSTLVVLVGLVAGQFGVGWMDAVAAIVVGLMVGWVGGRLMWQSSRELIDTALPVEEQRAMRRLAESVPGVKSVHDLRTRQLGSDVVLDLHIVVAPRVTVSEAHEIGNAVSRQLREAHTRLKDVTFHIDPEDDEGQTEHSLRPGLPLREEIEQLLDERWSHQRAWQHRTALNLHYLDDRIDISLYVDSDIHHGDLDDLAHQLCRDLDTLPWVGQLKLWQGPGKA